MMRLLTLLLVMCFPMLGAAQSARLDTSNSQIVDTQDGISGTFYLSSLVPYRAFTVVDPPRLVIDLQGVEIGDFNPADIVASENIADAKLGYIGDGWVRFIINLGAPLSLDMVEMRKRAADGTAILTLSLIDNGLEAFERQAGSPPEVDVQNQFIAAPSSRTNDLFVVVIDPGHGGIDPGAERAGVAEADLVLTIAQELAARLADMPGVSPVLTRNTDTFVSLNQRLTRARDVGADVFISLHADALAEDTASGLSVYTLGSEDAGTASQRMVERHERGDLVAGLDLSGHDDRIATVLMDLARRETTPASDQLAQTLVQAARENNVGLNSRARREGPFVVLSAADFPSVLIELGFLSSPNDRQSLLDPVARGHIIEAIAQGVMQFRADTSARGSAYVD